MPTSTTLRLLPTLALVLGLSAACHQKAAPESQYRVNPNVVSRAELAEVGTGSVYDATANHNASATLTPTITMNRP